MFMPIGFLFGTGGSGFECQLVRFWTLKILALVVVTRDDSVSMAFGCPVEVAYDFGSSCPLKFFQLLWNVCCIYFCTYCIFYCSWCEFMYAKPDLIDFKLSNVQV